MSGNAKMNLAGSVVDMFCQYCTVTRSRHLRDDKPETAGERLVNIKPPASHLFSGILASTTRIRPVPVKGVWLPSLPPQDSTGLQDQKIVLHFPGGAFVITFGHSTSGRSVAEILTRHLKADRVLWAQYRLAANEETRAPAALQDALTYYTYLISSGVQPKNIVLSGASAGGNIVLALMRHLESQSELPLPGSAILFSPWVEVTPHAAEDYKAYSNTEADVLSGEFLQWGADSYLPSDGELASDETMRAYVSPLHHPFKTSIPIFIHAGAAEAFLETIKVFAEEMQALGNEVRFYAAPKGPHDLLLNYELFGMKDELTAAVDEARVFLSNQRN